MGMNLTGLHREHVFTAVVILVIGAVIITVIACLQINSRSPLEVARSWTEAWAQGDVEGVRKHTVSWQAKDLNWDLVRGGASIMAQPIFRRQVLTSPDSAYVIVDFTDGSTTAIWLFNEGEWKVDVEKTLREMGRR